ncbi:MAG: recombinase family protein [Bacillota bacterium]|nr:recombinase family protein [Bacillota bacterium]
MHDVEVIKAKKNKFDDSKGKRAIKIRVAPYCRVSTDSDEQLASYDSQVAHYKQKIEEQPNWELSKIYSDAGISGTGIEKRIGFKEMIRDALAGEFDLVITKSISRFGRNTKDVLEYTRLLKKHNVAVLFEKENINTFTMQGEVMISVLTSLAQQESESISVNVKMGLKMKMRRGELVGFQGCLGYDYDKASKDLVINEEEAVAVRYIFDRYNQGMGARIICNELMERGYKTKRGSTKWGDSTVRGILKNEKYMGDLLLGKTFTVDPITKQRLDNKGEEEMYYIKDHHEPIISKEIFEAAQAIRNKRNCNMEKGRVARYSRQYTFSSKIKCGFCEGTVGRRAWNSGSKSKKAVWHCIKSSKHGKKYCPDSKGLAENIIEEGFVKVFNEMCTSNAEIIEEFLLTVEKSIGNSQSKKELDKLNSELTLLESKIQKLIDLHLDGAIDRANYENKYINLNRDKENLMKELNELSFTASEEKSMIERLKTFRKYFDDRKPLKKFDADVFSAIVDYVVLGGVDEIGKKDPYLLTFMFRTGLKPKINVKKDLNMKSKSRIKEKSEKIYSQLSTDTC